MITISAGQLFVWIVLGGLAGAVAGMLVRGNRRGFGLTVNIVIGMIGAAIGSALFDLLGISIASDVVFSLDDFIAAIVGSLILLAIITLLRRFR